MNDDRTEQQKERFLLSYIWPALLSPLIFWMSRAVSCCFKSFRLPSSIPTFPTSPSSWYRQVCHILTNMMRCDVLANNREYVVAYREDMALVTRRFRASSFFFKSSEVDSSSSSWLMASDRVCSIFSFWPRFNFRDSVGSEIMSSTRAM